MIKLVDLLTESISKDFEFPTFDYLDDKEKELVEKLISEFMNKMKVKDRLYKNMIGSLIVKIRDSGKELYGEKNPFHDVVNDEFAMIRDEPISLEFIKDFLLEYPDFIDASFYSEFFRDDDLSKKLREILVNWMSVKKPNSSKLYDKLKKDIDKNIVFRTLDANIK